MALQSRLYALYLSTISALGHNAVSDNGYTLPEMEHETKRQDKLRLHSRRGAVQIMPVIITAVLFVVLMIIIGALLPTGLGTVANGSIGSKMTNVDSTSKGIYSNINVIAIIVIIIFFIAIAYGAFKSFDGKSK